MLVVCTPWLDNCCSVLLLVAGASGCLKVAQLLLSLRVVCNLGSSEALTKV